VTRSARHRETAALAAHGCNVTRAHGFIVQRLLAGDQMVTALAADLRERPRTSPIGASLGRGDHGWYRHPARRVDAPPVDVHPELASAAEQAVQLLA